jgi:hypothetical protein
MASSGVAALHASSDAAATRAWLIGAGVSAEGLAALADFSAADVLALSKDDAKEMLGAGTGIRVWNRLHDELKRKELALERAGQWRQRMRSRCAVPHVARSS